MIKSVFTSIIIIHGLIHLMGFVKAYDLAEINQLSHEIGKPAGILWLASAMLFITTAAVYLLKYDWWWMAVIPPLLFSQVLIIMSWQDAKFGTIANIIILTGCVIGFGAWSFTSMTANELQKFSVDYAPVNRIITGDMIKGLPDPVQKWLIRSNLTGRNVIYKVKLKQLGEMRTTMTGNWMPVEAEQWFNTVKPGFIWITDVKAAPGIHLAGRDKYTDGKGHMLIKLLSLFAVTDAAGREIDQGAMLRYLAEIAWFPDAALNSYIKWEQVDSTSARATMTYGDITASGLFMFDSNGDLSGFKAKRYYARKDGATLEDWFIQIDPAGFKEFDSVRIPSRCSVTWKLKEGDFNWFRLEITDIKFN